MRVFLDPAAGGADTGTTCGDSNLKASMINLDTALRAAEFLRIESFSVNLSRTSDADVSLQRRAGAANDWRADIYVAIDTNSAQGPAASGCECQYRFGSTLGRELAHYIIDTLTEYNGLRIRGVRPSNSHILSLPDMPAAIVGLACITNPAEAELLARSDFRSKCAYGIAVGIKRYFEGN